MRPTRYKSSLLLLFAVLLAPAYAAASELADTSLDVPTWTELLRVVTLRDYNTRIVVLGTGLLGAAAGIAGTFLVLRKRALLSDAVSHATLPGIVLAYIVATLLGGDGKSLPLLLAGAAATGLLGMGGVSLIAHTTRLKDDAALGIVLSVFFGIGVALLTIATRMETGQSAGLMSFIYGKTASMVLQDAVWIAVGGGVACVVSALLFKEFTLHCFDPEFARSDGWPPLVLDMTMMGSVVLVTVIGLQAVGLILVVALLVIPPSAARFWTEDLKRMALAAAAIGALSGVLGSAASALAPKLPAGAVIVLVAAAGFFLSLLLGTERGLLARWLRHARLSRRIERQHLLRAFWELIEDRGEQLEAARAEVGALELLSRRSWTMRQLVSAVGRARRLDLLEPCGQDVWRLTPEGVELARRTVRNHRLWEMYLITHADIAPSHVDRDADAIEHVLDPDMIHRLETLLAEQDADRSDLPGSPHSLTPSPGLV